MAESPRYALYYMPPTESPLWQFGARVIGYDAADPVARPEPFPELAAAAAAGQFREPRRYGFHATLKAPFELAADRNEASLLDQVNAFASRQARFSIGLLRIALLDRFVALVPQNAPAELNEFAANCVREIEAFRAPLTADDRTRRLRSRLTDTEIAYLDRWGYPYVFELFQFHMTLSGPLPLDFMGPLHEKLTTLYEPIGTELSIDGIAIFKQTARSERFQVLRRFAFG